MKKTCKVCGEAKPVPDFYARSRMRDGLSNMCKPCEIAKQREWATRPEVAARRRELARLRSKANPRSPEDTRRHRLWSWHRITPDQYDTLLDRQGGRCAIPACGAISPGGNGTWHVDHDHSCCPGKKSCGKCVRGLLCARCNPMLGMARDDSSILEAAITYLARGVLPLSETTQGA